MAYRTSEILNAVGMTLPLYVGGQTKVGFSLSGTWVGTVVFEASTDGVNFTVPLSVTPYASGTSIQSATANGSWESQVLNYSVVRMRVTALTSGSITAIAAASQDSSYQNAFFATTTLYPTSSATHAVNTLTQASQANRAWHLKTLSISISGQPAWLTSPNLQIKDGTSVIWALDIPLSGSSGQVFNVTLPTSPSAAIPGNQDGLIGTPSNSFSVVVADAGTNITTRINASFQTI